MRIHWTILAPDQRAENVPPDTRATPFVAWANGYLEEATAGVGERVHIRTEIGRILEGTLVEIAPRTAHDFGSPQAELLAAGRQLRDVIR